MAVILAVEWKVCHILLTVGNLHTRDYCDPKLVDRIALREEALGVGRDLHSQPCSTQVKIARVDIVSLSPFSVPLPKGLRVACFDTGMP